MEKLFEENGEVLNSFVNFSPHENSFITVCNTGNTLIPAWSAGKVGSPLHLAADNRADLFTVLPAVDEESPWGILSAPLAPGETGEMMMTGVLPAMIAEERVGNRVRPTENGLQISFQGRGELLSYSGSEGIPSTILLGTLCGTLYNGCFKLIPTGGGVKIVNGRDLSSPVCGYTDLPGCTTVPAAEFETFAGTLYLYATHDAEGYHTHFGAYDASMPMRITIGYVGYHYVEQYFNEDTAKFGREYFL